MRSTNYRLPDVPLHLEVERLLGEGGMGQVYLAKDPINERRVAVKVVKRCADFEYSDVGPTLGDRLWREALILREFQDPNMVVCKDYGEIDRGFPYLVMDLLEGKNLKEMHIERGGLDPRYAVDIMISVARVTGALHEKGIVWRDLKPSNVIIDSRGRATCVDFGTAQFYDSKRRPFYIPSLDEEEGTMAGSIRFAAPEIVTGSEPDPLSEIYSFGVLLHLTLTNEHPQQIPFSIPDVEAYVGAIIYMIMTRDPTPLSRSIPDIDPRLESIVLRMLEKDPANRHESMGEVIADLKAVKQPRSRVRRVLDRFRLGL